MPLTTATKLSASIGAAALALAAVGVLAVSTQGTDIRGRPGLSLAFLIVALSLLWAGYRTARAYMTEMERISEALRASEGKFSGILEIAADAIITCDADQRVLHFNHGAEAIFGYQRAEVVGRPLADLLPARFRGTHAVYYSRFSGGNETARRMGERREIFGLRKNGVEFPAEASISKLETPSGPLFTVVLRDVTDRKLLEENQRVLSESGAILATTLDVDATLRTIAQLPVPRLGDAALVAWVTPEGQLRRTTSIVPDAALSAGLSAIAATPLSWDSPVRAVDVLRSKRAEIVAVDDDWLEAHTVSASDFAAWRSMDPRSVLLVPMIARDHVLGVITCLRCGPEARAHNAADLAFAEELAFRSAFALDNAWLYRSAQQATRARDDVLGVVSHDLRNPLSAISMCTRVLLESPPADDEQRRELLGAIGESTEWMGRLIRDLLDVANIEVGKLALERRPEALGPILETAMQLFARQADEKRISLQLETPPTLPAVEADAGRVLQVLSNLLNNALKYTEAGGRVTVGAAPADGRMVRVVVRDTGAGIPADQLPHVFRRYWTSRRTARSGGSGLGLAIAQGIVDAHGGCLTVQSREGEGSQFAFTLPVAGD